MHWRVYLAIGGLAAAAAGLGYWSLRVETAACRSAMWAENQAPTAVSQALERPIDLTRQTVSLLEFAQMIERAAGVQVVVAEQPLRDAGILVSQTELHLSRATLPCSSALDLFLREHDLQYTIVGDEVYITTPDDAESRPPQIIVYPLPQPDLSSGAADAEAWADAVTTLIDQQCWDQVGGPGSCLPVPGALIVAQQPRIQEQVRVLVERLGRLGDPPPAWQPVPIWPVWDSGRLPQVLDKLRRPASIDCRAMPLDELLDYLSREHDLPMVVNIRELSDSGINGHAKVTKTLSGTLQSVLENVLADFELTISVQDGAAVVTTPDDAEVHLWTVAFPVHDLVRCGAGRRDLERAMTGNDTFRSRKSPAGCDFVPLIDLIEATIAPNQWADVGGPGTCDVYIGGWLLVSQTYEILEQIEQLLAQLRRGLSAEEHPWILETSTAPAAYEHMVLALEHELPFDSPGLRLVDLCADLASQSHIRIELDERRLKDAGLSSQTRLECSFPPAPLRVQLARLCRLQSLGVAVHRDALLITSPDEVDSHLITRLYDVRTLVDPDLGLADWFVLRDMVTDHIDPHMWDDVGGPGSIDEFRGLMVVSQTLEHHRQVAALLSVLKVLSCKLRQPLADDPSAGPGIHGVPILRDAAEEELLSRLERPVSDVFENLPLKEAVSRVASATGLKVQFDREGRGRTSVPLDWQVSLRAKDLPLATALARILPRQVSYMIRDRELWITSVKDVEEQRETRLYDIRPLFAGLPIADRETWLLDLVTEHVRAASWDAVGGSGSLTCHGGLLAVTNAPAVHQELEALLSTLATRENIPAEPGDESARLTLEQGLVMLEMTDVPLIEAISELSRSAGLPIWIDESAVADAILIRDQNVNCPAGLWTVGEALEQFLPAELGYFVQTGELAITAAPIAERHLQSQLVRCPAAFAKADRAKSGFIPGVPAEYWYDKGGLGAIDQIGDDWLLITADLPRQFLLTRWLKNELRKEPATDH